MAKKACKFVKVGKAYHSGTGPLGRYTIRKLTGQRGYRVKWTGGAAKKAGQTWVPTLRDGKELVAYWLNCRLPRRRKR